MEIVEALVIAVVLFFSHVLVARMFFNHGYVAGIRHMSEKELKRRKRHDGIHR